MHSEFPNYYHVLSKSFKKTLLNRLTAADLPVTGTLIDDANNWFLSRSAEFAQRALIDAFHAWRETTGYPDNAESSAAYDEFNRLLLDPTQRTALVNDRFPKLGQLQERVFSYSIDAVVEAVERFYEDRPHLAMLNVKADDTIVSLGFHGEETHNHGRTAIVVTTDSAVVVYKPRSGMGEIAIDMVCRHLGAAPFSLVAPTIDIGDYCWQLFINPPATGVVDVPAYMRAAGTLLAACHILGTTDLHVDNICCSSAGLPTIIDGETALQFRLPAGLNLDATDVLASGMLPTVLSRSEFWRHFSGLNFFPHEKTATCVKHAVTDSGTDAVAFLRVSYQHPRPPIVADLQNIDPAQAMGILIESFEKARVQAALSPTLAAYVRDMERVLRWRQVLRATGTYQSFLEASLMPAALAGLDDPLTLLDKGPRGMVDGPTIGVQERLQLADGDVPFFQMDATGKVYDGAGHHVGQASFTDRFSLPSSRLADFTSIAGPAYAQVLDANAHALTLHQPLDTVARVTEPDMRQEILKKSTALPDSGGDRWLCFGIGDEDLTIEAHSISFLMSDGTSWALSDADELQNRWEEFVREAPEFPANFVGFGPGTSLLVTQKAAGDATIVDKLPSVMASMDTTTDFLGGIDAALAALAHVTADVNPQPIVKSAMTFIGHQLQAAQPETNAGIAHGAAGLLLGAHGLVEFSRARNLVVPDAIRRSMDTIADGIAKTALTMLTDPNITNGLAWCNGASGIAGALAITGHLVHYPGLVDTYLTATQAKTTEPASDDDQVGIDVSLCHGLAGTLSTLQLLRDFGYADPKVVDKFHAYVEHIALTAPICFGYPNNIHDMGYLNGLGGTYHALYPENHGSIRPLFAGN